MKKLKIACIGSREITEEIGEAMAQVGAAIVSQGWWLASGNALGSDVSYARGGNSIDPTRVMLYLPWRTYNEEFIVEGNRLILDVKDEWKVIARRHHPRYPLLSKGAQGMMDRNAGIVRNADAVIAYLNRTKIGGGGTGHGWRIADALAIPRIDVSLPRNLKNAIEWLSALSKE